MYLSGKDNKLLDFSIKLADILDLFHRILKFSPDDDIFNELDHKCQELYNLMNYIIDFMDMNVYKENLNLESLLLLIPMVGLIKKIETNRIKSFSEKHHTIVKNFENILTRTSDFLNALQLYYKDKGSKDMNYYLEEYARQQFVDENC